MKIGVDGGGTKTELILIDEMGELVERHLAGGCNPSVAGPTAARQTLADALSRIAAHHPVSRTMLCMAGAPAFWSETAATLDADERFGQVTALDDSRPVLELATRGKPGLVLHAGTGSFVAAQAPDGSLHYAGGTGWRFGDPGSGYDIGRRAISKAIMELQGWQLTTRISTVVRDHTGLTDAADITRHFYHHAEPNKQIAALAPALLRLAAEGDHAAYLVIAESVTALLQIAEDVITKLFPGWHRDLLQTGVAGPILTHAAVRPLLSNRSSLQLRPIAEAPIEGVRRLLLRSNT